MGAKKLKIEYGDSVFALPRESVLSSLPKAGAFELKVLMLLASNDALRADLSAAREHICKELDCTGSAFDKAVAFWSDSGVISTADAAGDKPNKTPISVTVPSYTESQAADVIDRHTELRAIIDACQQITEKIFTPADTQTIVGIYDYLGLRDTGYIETLCNYCKSLGKTSARYIERVAVSMADEGVDTTDALNEYIARREQLENNTARIRLLIGAQDRALTSKEKKLFECWLTEWNFAVDVITRAYEVTVDKLGTVKLTYMNKVLENWHRDGLDTLEAVEASLEKYSQSKADAAKNGSGFETDEYFEAALARSQKYLENSKKEG